MLDALVILLVVVCGATWYPAARRSFDDQYNVFDRDILWTSTASRSAAEKVLEIAGPEERVLITPMHYYTERVKVPCPIFVWYLGPREVVVAPFTVGLDEVRQLIRDNRIDVAMLSPPPSAQETLLKPLILEDKLKFWELTGAVVFRTTPLYE